MYSSCNHVAAALFRLEAAFHSGLCNPACTTKPCEWLPSRSKVDPCKVMDMNLNRDDFKKRNKSTRKLISTPKKNFNPIAKNNTAILNFNTIVEALGDMLGVTTLSTAVPKPEIDFFREVLTKQPSLEEQVISLNDIVLMSSSSEEFLKNLNELMTLNNIEAIEKFTKGQSCNSHWFDCRKGVITASKIHEVKTKMAKVEKGSSDVNVWALVQKVGGLTFTNPCIPALKYGREMETDAAEKLLEILKQSHKNCTMRDCGLFICQDVPFVGASPDRILSCSCHGKWTVEIKCPYSISHLAPTDTRAKLPYMEDNKLKQTHQYYTQCQLQMGVLNVSKCLFFVYTSHGFILTEINFDKELYTDLLRLCKLFYKDHYLKSLFES